MSVRPGIALSLGLALLLSGALANAQDQEEAKVVIDGKQVSIEYTLKLEDGSTADTNVGGEPLVFTAGSQQILPALESALQGLAVDESRSVVLPPEKGYGPVDPGKFERIPIDKIPEEARFAGAMLVAADPSGQQRPVRVHEVEEQEIILDLNHPLAGQTLSFDVRIVAID